MHEIDLSGRSRAKEEKATEADLTEFRGGLGQVGWVAGSCIPQASVEASLLARRVNDLKVEDLLFLNKAMRKIQELKHQRIWYRRLWQKHPLRPTLGVLADSSLNNELDEEHREETGELEKSDSQQAFLVAAVEERPHLVAYGQSRVPMNLLAWGSNKCPRKCIGSFGAEGISLVTGSDRAVGIAYLLDELQGWAPRLGVLPTTPIFSLTDGDSVCSFLLGNKVTGLEQRLFSYLAWLRQTLRLREIMAVGHLTAERQYVDLLTKRTGTNPALMEDLIATGEFDFRSKKQSWNRIAAGRERFKWKGPLRLALHDQPERLRILLAKGRRRAGSIWVDQVP